jgi:hypothetical protein
VNPLQFKIEVIGNAHSEPNSCADGEILFQTTDRSKMNRVTFSVERYSARELMNLYVAVCSYGAGSDGGLYLLGMLRIPEISIVDFGLSIYVNRFTIERAPVSGRVASIAMLNPPLLLSTELAVKPGESWADLSELTIYSRVIRNEVGASTLSESESGRQRPQLDCTDRNNTVLARIPARDLQPNVTQTIAIAQHIGMNASSDDAGYYIVCLKDHFGNVETAAFLRIMGE